MALSRLPREEVSRRIKAARDLRQMHQITLAALMEEDGLNKSDLGQIERCDRQMRLGHQESILRHLRLPERWLTAETVDEIVGEAISDAQLIEILGPQLLAAFRAAGPSGEQEPQGQDEQDHHGESSEETDE